MATAVIGSGRVRSPARLLVRSLRTSPSPLIRITVLLISTVRGGTALPI
jgi:hypothetical protein